MSLYKGVIDQPVYDRPVVEQDRVIHPAWLWAALAMLVLSLVVRQGALFLAGSLLLCTERVSYLWGRRALLDIAYRRTLSADRAAFGETVTLRLETDNRKPLPLPWLRVEDDMPASLQINARLGASHLPDRRLLRTLLAMLWYQRVARRYAVTCTARGEHVFGPAELHAGDVFGLSTGHLKIPARDTLLVYPKVVPLAALGLPAVYPFGDLRAPQRLFEDPLRTIGIRDYAVGDSPRHIHWKATARTGALQVRVFEPVRTLRAVLFLDVVTGALTNRAIWQGYDPDLLELAIVVAASTAAHLLEGGFAVGLNTNGLALRREGLVAVAPSAAPSTHVAMLEALALLGPMPAAPLDRVIAHEGPHLPPYTSAVVISAAVGPALIGALERLRADGRAVALVCVGDETRVPAVPGVTVRHVGGERRWRALPALDVG